MYFKLQSSYLLLTIICFSYLSQIKTDLVKGVLLGALIAKQKSGEKIIVIPINGGDKYMDKSSSGREGGEEEEQTTTDYSTTTTAGSSMQYMQSNMNTQNKQLMQNMKKMAQMMNQLMGQQNSQQNNQQYNQQNNQQNNQQSSSSYQSSGKQSSGNQKNQMMMMMPVVSMKGMDSNPQPMTMSDTHNIGQIQEMQDYDEYDELPQHLSQFSSKQAFL